ncbi:MAG: hypothetical protein GC192_07090 [Bacteroidetes bacterium]|nr:hypothetical protein [Bacteroidota bacterium]
MKRFRFISMLVLLVFTTAVFSQTGGGAEKKAASKSKRLQRRDYIGDAKLMREKSPQQAVKLLEEALLYAKKDEDFSTQAEAYALLGNIYEDIGQKELALQRYQQAITANSNLKNGGNIAQIHQRMGQLYLDLKNALSAESSFKICLQVGRDTDVRQRCEEGLADVALLRGNANASISQLDQVQKNYPMDSASVSRLEGKRSNVYIQQNELDKASQSYRNSVNSLPSGQKLDKADYENIEQAQTQLLANADVATREKIEIAKLNALKYEVASSNNDEISGNLKVAAVYESSKNFKEAERIIERSKTLVNASTDAVIAAEVFEKSAANNRRKGDLEAALTDMERYIEEREKAIENSKAELAQQVEIVKGQQGIDVKIKEYDLQQTERELLRSQVSRQRIAIGLLSLLLLASLVFFYYLNKNINARRKAHQKLMLKSLRTQMNPHFIFNALNSVNNFIAKNDEKAANKYLADFSRLMRKVLDYSQRDFISFEEELELNELYLRLEHFRFRDQFDFSFENKLNHPANDLEVPPMLIQPFIENAVWHGLRYKNGHGKLSVTVYEEGKNILVTVLDDGIGREKSKAQKTENQRKQKSEGLENVSKRIALINELYGKNYEIKVQDADADADDVGTLVAIKIPA